MLANDMNDAALRNRRLWPACLNEPLSYEEQVRALIEKIKELDERVTILEGEVNND